MREITPTLSCYLGVIGGLDLALAKYIIRQTHTRTFSITVGITSWRQGNTILSQIPEKNIISFKKTNPVHGDYLLNPHHLEQCNIRFFSLYVNGHQIPTKALQPSFTGQQADYVRSFMHMQSGLGTSFRNCDIRISYKAYARGSTVFVLDLSTDQSNRDHTDPTKWRSLRAEVRLGAT